MSKTNTTDFFQDMGADDLVSPRILNSYFIMGDSL